MKFITPTLLCFLLLALPAASLAQSTATPWPTANPTQIAEVEARQIFPLQNPTEVAPCGLPVRSASLSAGSFTWTMTGDCVIRDSAIHSDTRFSQPAFMTFTGGTTFTINGNGHSIIGPSIASVFHVANGVTLNLNNVNIRDARSFALVDGATSSLVMNRGSITGTGAANAPVAEVRNGGTFTATDVTFQNNRALSGVAATHGSVDFRNVRFRDNRFQQAVISSVNIANRVFINEAEFVNNAITEGEDVISIQAGDLILEGRIAYRANRSSVSGGQANLSYVGDIGAILSTNAEIIEIRIKKKEEAPTATPTPRPLAVTCPALSQATGIAVSATYGLTSGIQCQRLNGAGIGVQSIIDAGFIDAVDIWGYVVQGVEVCFPQAGRILFLDARTIPRAIVPLESNVVNGMTCASISSPGSLVLMPN